LDSPVGHTGVKAVAVRGGVDGDGLDAELAAGADDADGDLATVCNQDAPKHRFPFALGTFRAPLAQFSAIG
jgi:hypothetical protein